MQQQKFGAKQRATLRIDNVPIEVHRIINQEAQKQKEIKGKGLGNQRTAITTIVKEWVDFKKKENEE